MVLIYDKHCVSTRHTLPFVPIWRRSFSSLRLGNVCFEGSTMLIPAGKRLYFWVLFKLFMMTKFPEVAKSVAAVMWEVICAKLLAILGMHRNR